MLYAKTLYMQSTSHILGSSSCRYAVSCTNCHSLPTGSSLRSRGYKQTYCLTPRGGREKQVWMNLVREYLSPRCLDICSPMRPELNFPKTA